MKKDSLDPIMGFAIAREFYNRATPEIIEMRDKIRDDEFEFELGKIAFLSTAIIFSCETYLKIALAVDGKTISTSHNIKSLFSNLPKSLKDELDRVYKGRMNEIKVDDNYDKGNSIRIRLKLPHQHWPKHDKKPEKNGDDLHNILGEMGDAYTAWRYVFQGIGGRDHIVFHFTGLCVLCGILDDYLVDHPKLKR